MKTKKPITNSIWKILADGSYATDKSLLGETWTDPWNNVITNKRRPWYNGDHQIVFWHIVQRGSRLMVENDTEQLTHKQFDDYIKNHLT